MNPPAPYAPRLANPYDHDYVSPLPNSSSTDLLTRTSTSTESRSASPAPSYAGSSLGSPSPAAIQRLAHGRSSSAQMSIMGNPRQRLLPSVSEKFSLPPDPATWGTDLYSNHPEPDDHMHNPDPKRDKYNDMSSNICTGRGLSNLGCIAILGIAMVGLFLVFPLLSFLFKRSPTITSTGLQLGVNASGQVPSIGNFGLIDKDTPEDAYTKKSHRDGTQLQLVFSDEFEQEGRTFYPGDDPYWEAVDLHYWGTKNMEWYDPSSLTTKNGALEISLSKKENHGLDYMGGMMSTWNKFCFTGGLVEASVMLPGSTNILGLWPAIWAMGNLGRAGYGASLDGTWPYTYDSCDVGTLQNQTLNGLPEIARTSGPESSNHELSYLGGQKLSRCTCPGESHPGPVHADGSYVGRSAPEIDIFEAQVDGERGGTVSQSGQWAPFNAFYQWFNTTDNFIIHEPDTTFMNLYLGGEFQQATSCISVTAQECYQLGTGCFSVYGFEYKPGFDDAYITWINDDKAAWTINAGGTAADSRVEIGPRPIPQEPMYIIANLGMSKNFGFVDIEHLTFPANMRVDWVRVYQRSDSINIGCDPPDFPTKAYIEEYIEAYTNPNLTTWVDDYKQPFPKNRLIDQC